jgi:hypothetical protein
VTTRTHSVNGMTLLPQEERRLRAQQRSLRPWVRLAMIAPLLAIPTVPSKLFMSDRLLAGLAWLLCLWPAWAYVTTAPGKRRPVPFLPVIGFIFGSYFPLQIVLGSTDVYGRFEIEAYVPELEPALYSSAISIVLGGWVMTLFGYWLVAGRVDRAGRQQAAEDLRVPRLTAFAFGTLLLALVVEIVKRTIPLSGPVRGMLYFVSSLTGLALALLIALAVQRRLSPRWRWALFAGIAATLILQASTGASAVVMITVITIGMAVILAGGKLTWRWVAVGLGGVMLFAAMRGVALEHRRATALAGQGAGTASSALLLALIAQRVQDEGVVPTVAAGLEVASTRSALTDLLADVIRQTPSIVPYWRGETYKSLIGAFVPRAFWPDKPIKTLGYDFGHRYGYLRSDDFTTTINLPFLVEFYANFSTTGVVVGMFLVGLIYGVLDRRFNNPGQSTLRSMLALGLMIPLINIESDFSLVFGGLFITGTTLFVLYRIARDSGSVALRVRDPRLGTSADRPRIGHA